MKTRTTRQPNPGERGFALLVVFLLAAGIMISLYLELPRVAFESQRNREEMLVERGEQYARGIELFYRKNKRYPQKWEDLENTNNLRFLRRRYKDPLTGKEEWREIHMGPAGQLADSLVEKPGQQAGQQLAGNGQPAQAGQPGQPGQPTGPEEINAAALRQQRDQGSLGGRRTFGPGSPGYDPNNPAGNQYAQQQFLQQQQQQQQLDNNGNPAFDPNQNQNQFGNNGFNPNNPQQQNGLPQQGFPGQGFPQQGFPGQVQNPSFPGQPINQPGPPGINPFGVQPGGPGQYPQQGGLVNLQQGQFPGQPGVTQNPALTAINNQIRNQTGYGQPGIPGSFGANQIPPGAIRLPDGSYKMPDGTILNPDGTLKYQDGTTQPKPVGQLPPGIGGLNSQNPGFGGGSGFGPNGQPQQGLSGGQTGFGNQLQTSQIGGGQSFGGAGIAGVASKQTGVGIMRYNDKSKYKEWEFIFDYRKPKTKAQTGAGANGLNQSNMNLSNPGGQPPRQPTGGFSK